jgi:uroporphyrinogen-III decarboxylase
MTSKERMAKAMAGGRPDRVPVMCQMSIGHMLLQTGIPPLEFWFSEERFREGLLDLRRRYEFDGILVSLHGHTPDWEKGLLRVARDGETLVAAWKDGSRTEFPPDDLPRHHAAEAPRPPAIADFDPESIPERLDYIPVSQGLAFRIDPARRVDLYRRILAEAGASYSIHGEVTSPLDYFLDLFGFGGGFLALAEDPARSKAVLERFAEGVVGIALEQARLGLDAIKISSPYAGAGFISPAHYRAFVLPGEARIARAVRAAGVPVYTHTCGAVRDRLEMMAEAGVSGIECLDPPPLGNVELADAKARLGPKVFIKGNIDPVNTLLFGTRAAVEADVRRCLAAGMIGGGYILSTACSIAPRTPAENVELLAPLASAEGRYAEVFPWDEK